MSFVAKINFALAAIVSFRSKSIWPKPILLKRADSVATNPLPKEIAAESLTL